MLSADAPEELCDPITMTLFVDPVVSPSGETYSKDTVSRFDNGLCPAPPAALDPSLTPTHTCTGIDPATREIIDDIARLPPNRAISRQVNGFIQKSLGKFADYLLLHTSDLNHFPAPRDSAPQIEAREEGEGAETAEGVTEAMLALASIMSAISGRCDDASLNFQRVVLQLLDSSSPVCVCVCLVCVHLSLSLSLSLSV